MSKVHQHTISQATTFAMWGGVAALNGYQQCIEAMRLKFDKRRKYVISELNLMGYEMAPAAVIAHRISAGFFHSSTEL